MPNYLHITLAGALMAAALSASAQYGSYSYGDGRTSSRDCGAATRDYSNNLEMVGLTNDQRLICFDEDRPGEARTIGTVTGLTGGDTFLIGIDFRVQDAKLYGVGNAGGVYRVDIATAAATPVNRLSIALSGSRFGVDFNPAADRLRIVSNTGQNLRHNVNAGGVTIADGALNYVAGAVALGVTGSAYTNNDLSTTTATTLYALDTNLNQIAIQSPPNNGSLAATGMLTVDTGDMTGFDIYSIVRNGITVDVLAFASLSTADGNTGLYEIALPTGKASRRGNFTAANLVVDIAIPLNQL